MVWKLSRDYSHYTYYNEYLVSSCFLRMVPMVCDSPQFYPAVKSMA
jgi:hypothetical protein